MCWKTLSGQQTCSYHGNINCGRKMSDEETVIWAGLLCSLFFQLITLKTLFLTNCYQRLLHMALGTEVQVLIMLFESQFLLFYTSFVKSMYASWRLKQWITWPWNITTRLSSSAKDWSKGIRYLREEVQIYYKMTRLCHIVRRDIVRHVTWQHSGKVRFFIGHTGVWILVFAFVSAVINEYLVGIMWRNSFAK